MRRYWCIAGLGCGQAARGPRAIVLLAPLRMGQASGTNTETRGSGPTSRVTWPWPVVSSAIRMSPGPRRLGLEAADDDAAPRDQLGGLRLIAAWLEPWRDLFEVRLTVPSGVDADDRHVILLGPPGDGTSLTERAQGRGTDDAGRGLPETGRLTTRSEPDRARPPTA
jgi:hypothetical protein